MKHLRDLKFNASMYPALIKLSEETYLVKRPGNRMRAEQPGDLKLSIKFIREDNCLCVKIKDLDGTLKSEIVA